MIGLLMVAAVGLLGVCEASESEGEAGSKSVGTESENGSTKGSEEDAEATPFPDDATLLKMRVRELKEILARKGAEAECKACTTKQEFVDRIRETLGWADVTATPSPSAEESVPSMEELRKMFAQNEDNEYMKKLKEQLKQAGINADVVGSGNKFANLNVEDLTKAYKDIKDDRERDADAGSESSKADSASAGNSGDEERTEL